jgi:hypothetical protein
MKRRSPDKNCLSIRRAGAMILPRCHICSEVPPLGIRGGIRLKKTFICSACEQQLVQTEVATAQYLRILEKLKEIFK